MLLCCLWAALPLVVLGQTYYINFVFNNYRYGSQFEQKTGTESTERQSKEDRSHSLVEQETLEISSKEICPQDEPPDSENRRLEHVHPNTDETFEIGGDLHISKASGPPKGSNKATSTTTITKKPKTTRTTRKGSAATRPSATGNTADLSTGTNTATNTEANTAANKETSTETNTAANTATNTETNSGINTATSTGANTRISIGIIREKNTDISKEKPIRITIGPAPETNTETAIEKNTETTTEKSKERATEKNTETVTETNRVTAPEIKRETAPEIKRETVTELKRETVTEIKRETVTEINTETATAKNTETAAATNTETATATNTETTTPHWLKATPHPSEFFDYPEAICHEDMQLHEVFGVTLARDRGLPVKILCEFQNHWGGPWLLMNRMELPARLHMRHWFFGYLTEDYKDININFLALAHIINTMRLAMLIIGQDNNNELVYNLYDNVVISGFNDLFMLRKAHLVEANTTDLLFVSVGEVIESDAGRNRSCPFRVLGAWWGPKWDSSKRTFCVFPVERDINRPGYMAIFIKPNPFEVNNTAFYEDEITTRRPWASTIDLELLARLENDRKKYNDVKEQEFHLNKRKVKEEMHRRVNFFNQGDYQPKKDLNFKTLTTIDQSMTKT
ncbi:uncharacterized protein [Drosophila virilis]|uniref:uncharacterized protein isoform X2 n=1 Tax=Drosophila virilis TaxID=7244 RepID=UPI00139653BD|nr:uncharacterized protein LOC6627971 isoform X2 [Drosophila virilis]